MNYENSITGFSRVLASLLGRPCNRRETTEPSMRTHQLSWNAASGWRATSADCDSADLVLYFGLRSALADGARYRELRGMFAKAHLIGCSTGGQIQNDDVNDDVAAVALRFDRTRLRVACEQVPGPAHSANSGAAIGRTLAGDDLAGIFVLSDGLSVNGSELVAGIAGVVGHRVPLTGGLAGDSALFEETLVGADGPPRRGQVAGIGFYGSAIRIGHGSAGGWDKFGPRRRITRSAGNVLHELDGEPALDLYERYLGEDDARGLPGTALLFPLLIHDPAKVDQGVVRTVLAVDRDARSMTFAGDMPEGCVAQLMRGNFDRLAAGAADAARQARAGLGEARDRDGLAVLVSCIGRRLLMEQHVTDEVEAAGAELGSRMPRVGFYSYGEISPHGAAGICQLHNQTMTVTAISEAA